MKCGESSERQRLLEDYIYELASKPLKNEDEDKSTDEDEKVKLFVDKLDKIYTDDFRHNYSGFFAVVDKICKEGSEYDNDILSDNLLYIREYVELGYYNRQEYQNLYKPLCKLYDHLNLEIARYLHYHSFESKTRGLENIASGLQEEMTKLNTEADSINKRFEKSTKEIKRANKKFSNIQAEIITVLGIFAALSVGGVGSFTALTGVFKSLEKISYYEFFITVTFTGLIVFDTAFMMLFVISRITGESIYTNCLVTGKFMGCSECKREAKCNAFHVLKYKLPYIYWFNAICLLIIIVNLFIESVVMKYPVSDWLMVLAGCVFVVLAVNYGLHNNFEKIKSK